VQGAALSTLLSGPVAAAYSSDGSALIYADLHSVQSLDLSSNSVSLLAGAAGSGSADGTGAQATFNSPAGLVLSSDGLSVYVSDGLNHQLRSVVLASGVVTTFAGSSGVAGFYDGAAGNAQFSSPAGLSLIDGELFVADEGNHRVRRVSTADGSVTTLAGSGVSGTVDGVGALATLASPRALAALLHGTSALYVGGAGCIIRMIVVATGVVSTVAGSASSCGHVNGMGVAAQLGAAVSAMAISVDGLMLYFADGVRIRGLVLETAEVFAVAGSGSTGNTDSANGASATFGTPLGLATSVDGTTLAVADSGNNKMRAVELSRLGCPPTAVSFDAVLPIGALLTRDEPLSAAASWRGGRPTSFQVSPALPAGLSIAADGTLSGSPTQAGTYSGHRVIASNAGGSSEAYLYFAVQGPSDGQSFSCSAGTSCQVVVQGFLLSTQNRILAIPSTEACGTTPSASFAPSTSQPTGSVTLLTFSGLTISQTGTFKICWWDGSGETDVPSAYGSQAGGLTSGRRLAVIGSQVATSSSPRHFYSVGAVSVGGPIAHQQFGAAVHEVFALTMLGTQLASSNRVAVVGPLGAGSGVHSCGPTTVSTASGGDLGAAVSLPRTPIVVNNSDRTALIFAGVQLRQFGTYQLCWSSGLSGGSSFSVPAGRISVEGPLSEHLYIVSADTPSSLTVSGTFMDAQHNRLGLLAEEEGDDATNEAENPCGSPERMSEETIPWASRGTVTGNSSSLVFGDMVVDRLGTFIVCWQAAVSDSIGKAIGRLIVQGPNPGQAFYATRDVPMNLTLLGTGLGSVNEVLILHGSYDCGADSTEGVLYMSTYGGRQAASAGGPTAAQMFTDVLVPAVGDFKICWWDGSGSSTGSTDSTGSRRFATVAGSLQVVGPEAAVAVPVNPEAPPLSPPALAQVFGLVVAGRGMTTSASVRLVPASDEHRLSCSSDSYAAELLSPVGSSTSLTFSRVVVDDAGLYRVCWCSGSTSACDLGEDFVSDVGIITVTGPRRQVDRVVLAKESFDIVWEGVGLTRSSRLYFLRASSGTQSPACAIDDSTAFSLPTSLDAGGGAQWSSVIIAEPGTFHLCWSDGTALGNAVAVVVGSLVAAGPLPLPEQSVATVGMPYTLVIRGIGLEYITRPSIRVAQAGSSCSGSTTVAGPSADVDVYSDGTGAVWLGVHVHQIGKYQLCWGHGAVEVFFGDLAVNGPSEWNTPAGGPIAMLPFSLSLSGQGLEAGDRIRLIKPTSQCSSAEAADTVMDFGSSVHKEFVADGFSLVFNGLMVNWTGELSLCWRGLRAGTEQNVGVLPQLVLRGPQTGADFSVVLSSSFYLTVVGTQLSSRSRIQILDASLPCGSEHTMAMTAGDRCFADTSAGEDDGQCSGSSVVDGATSRQYGPMTVRHRGAFHICWCHCDGQDSDGRYHIDVGSLNVLGPQLDQRFDALMRVPFALALAGEGLSESNRIEISSSVASDPCIPGHVAVSVSHGNSPSVEGGGMQVLWDSVSVSAIGVFTICWWPSAGAGGALLDQGHAVGSLRVGGPLFDQDVVATMGVPFDFSLAGSMLAISQRVIAIEFSKSCSAANDASDVDLGVATAPSETALIFGGIVFESPGSFRMCWGDSATSPRPMLDVGSLTVEGPILDARWEVSIGAVSQMVVTGSGLVTDNRLQLVPYGAGCEEAASAGSTGASAGPTAVGVLEQPGGPIGGSSAMTYSGMVIRSLGTYTVCWSADADSHASVVGEIIVGGPASYWPEVAMVGVLVDIHVLGSRLGGVNQIHIVRDSSNCNDESVASVAASGLSVRPKGSASALTFQGIRMSTPGDFVVCWKDGSLGSMYVPMGSLAVLGPHNSRDVLPVAEGEMFSYTVTGVALSPQARLALIPDGLGCSAAGISGESSMVHLSEESTGNSSRLSFANLTVTSQGQYILCLSDGSSEAFERGRLAAVGGLSVGGPLRAQAFSTVAGRTFQVVLLGTLMPASSQIAIANTASSCGPGGQQAAEVGISPHADEASSPASLTFGGLLATQAGFFRVCWSANGGNTGTSLETFAAEAGTLEVAGPAPDQAFSAAIGVAFDIGVGGTSLTLENRVRVVSGQSACGTAGQHQDITFADHVPSLGSASSGRIVFGGLVAMSSGSFNMCWCESACSEDSDFVVDFGSLTVVEPSEIVDVGQTFSALMNTTSSLTLTGTSLMAANRLLVVAGGSACGTVAASSAVVDMSNDPPRGSLMSMLFGDLLRVTSPGMYRVCWWDGQSDHVGGGGAQSFGAFTIEVGVLIVSGPHADHSFHGLVNVPIELAVEGIALSPIGQLLLRAGGRSCSSGSDDAVALVEQGPGSIASLATFQEVEFAATGKYLVCWCNELQIGSASNVTSCGIDVGHVEIHGPAARNFDAIVNQGLSLVIGGSRLHTANRIMLMGGAATCGSSPPSANIVVSQQIPSGGGSSLVFADMKATMLGTYRICWWDGKSGSDRPEAYRHHVGVLVVRGPLPGHEYSALVHSWVNITISGEVLSATNQIRILDYTSPCGSASEAPAVLSASLVTVSERSISFKASVASAGHFRICWWDGEIGDEAIARFATDVGELVVHGPTDSVSKHVLLNVPFDFEVSGTWLDAADGVALFHPPVVGETCGHSVAPVQVFDSTSVGNTSARTFRLVLDSLGPHDICWRGGHGSEVLPSQPYRTHVGGIVVLGPEPSQHFELTSGASGSLVVTGSGLSADNCLHLSSVGCAENDGLVFHRSQTGTSSAKTYANITQMSSDVSLHVCWWAKCPDQVDSVAGTAGFEIGMLQIVGPLTAQIHFVAAGSGPLSVVLPSLGLATNRQGHLLAIPHAVQCGQGDLLAVPDSMALIATHDVTLSSNTGEQTLQFQGPTPLNVGLHRLCWAASEDRASSRFVDVGSLTVTGPIGLADQTAEVGGILWIHTPANLLIRGIGLRQTDHIYVLPAEHSGGCSGNVASFSQASLAHAMPSSILASENSLFFGPIEVQAVGLARVCWWDGSAAASSESVAIEVGTTVVGGPSEDQQRVTTLGVEGSLEVNGPLLPSSGRLKIVTSSSECGSVDSSPSVTSFHDLVAAPVPNQDAESNGSPHLTYHGVVLHAIGTFHVCWWSGISGSNTYSSYRTLVGELVVLGPVPGQTFRLELTSSPGMLTVVGTGFAADDRLDVILFGGACGEAVPIVSAWPSVVNDSMAVYTGLMLASSGEYGVCWSAQSASSTRASFAIGILDVVGPSAGHTWALVVGTESTLQLLGTQGGQIAALPSVFQCENMTSTVAALTVVVGIASDSSVASSQALAASFTRFQIDTIGTFRMCWTQAGGSAGPWADVGTLVVGGPARCDTQPSQTAGAGNSSSHRTWTRPSANGPFNLVLQGSSLGRENEVVLLRRSGSSSAEDAPAPPACGSSPPGGEAAALLRLPSGTPASMTFHGVYVRLPGVYRTCWWSGLSSRSGEGANRHNTDLGLFTVAGPDLVRIIDSPVASVAFSLEVEGFGLVADNRLLLIDAARQCGDLVESSLVLTPSAHRNDTATASVLTFDAVTVADAGEYRACWWNGIGASSENNSPQASDFVVDVALIQVAGPALGQQFEALVGAQLMLTVEGFILSELERVRIIASGDECGQAVATENLAGVLAPATLDSDADGKHILLQSAHVTQVGSYSLCWWAGPERDLQQTESDAAFVTHIGVLRILGPTVELQLSSTLLVPLEIRLSGAGLSLRNGLRISDGHEGCDRPAATSGAEPGPPLLPKASRSTSQRFHFVPEAVGNFSLCWCHSGDAESRECRTLVGHVVVDGPQPRQAWSLPIGQPVVLNVSGSELSTHNAIVL
jgi:hypothetical protein